MDRTRHRPRLTRPRSRPRYPSRMRLSHLFFTTLRDDPADAEMASHRLLLRAGYVRQLGSGIYSLLPLGKRVNDRVAQVIREEQNAIGGQEIEMPVVHPADVWRASGRYDAIGPELGRFKDRNGRDMVLAFTHEEVVGLLLGDIVQSWRQLPPAGLSLPDQVARRAAGPRRPHPRPGIRHEGRLQRRPRPGRARCQLRGAARRLPPDIRAAGARRRRCVVGRRGHGWQPGPRVHGAEPGRRGRPRPVRVGALRREPADRANAQARGARGGHRGRPPARGGRDARHDDDRHAGRVPRHRPGRGPPRPRSS